MYLEKLTIAYQFDRRYTRIRSEGKSHSIPMQRGFKVIQTSKFKSQF